MSGTNNTERPDLPHTTSFNSASAYASAESSPRQSLTSSQSASSLKNLQNNGNTNDDMYKSANSSANNSFNDLAQVSNDQASTSTLSTASGASVVAATNVKKLIDESIQASLQEKQQPIVTPAITSPTPTTKASVLSFIEKMFVKSSPPPNQTKLTSSTSSVGLAKDLTVLQSSISSSSPNPECSPFKLLDNEIGHQQQQQQNHSPNYMKPVSGSTLSPNGTTINDAVAIFNASNAAAAAAASAAAATASSSTTTVDSLKKTTVNCPEGTIVNSSLKMQTPVESIVNESTNKIIESLALLNNHKEHERADPVLQSSIPSSSLPISLNLASSSIDMSHKKVAEVESSDIPIESKLTSLRKTDLTTNIDHSVPSSSREFCMDLNFNLAAAAAVFAAAPLAISGNLT